MLAGWPQWPSIVARYRARTGRPSSGSPRACACSARDQLSQEGAPSFGRRIRRPDFKSSPLHAPGPPPLLLPALNPSRPAPRVRPQTGIEPAATAISASVASPDSNAHTDCTACTDCIASPHHRHRSTHAPASNVPPLSAPSFPNPSSRRQACPEPVKWGRDPAATNHPCASCVPGEPVEPHPWHPTHIRCSQPPTPPLTSRSSQLTPSSPPPCPDP